jgi:arylsulfatase A-like enzyme
MLFIMLDQLRWDHLACNGHPTIRTPNIDALAQAGVSFDSAFVQAGVCGPSRMSYYTGRYVSSHGVTWNRVPLGIEQLTIGDYLRPLQRKIALVGKSHVIADLDGLSRLGIRRDSPLHQQISQGGFDVIDRIDGHGAPDGDSGYTPYLRAQGYAGDDPWSDYVVSGVDALGKIQSGWFLRNVQLAARVAEEHSETAYVTDVAINYITAQCEKPWALHLSYVKPHWPYIAPAPFHNMYNQDDCLPIAKVAAELLNPHPVYAAYLAQEESQTFAQDKIAHHVRPAYMGLISQVDIHIGRVVETLKRLNLLDETLIVLTSDHGDFGGDHWLGEKDLFHDAVIRVPLIVCDPRESANATRGTRNSSLVEAIDVLPTLLDAIGSDHAGSPLEGRSLLPLVHGQATAQKEFVVAEIDYSFRRVRRLLGREPYECRGVMIRDARWKYVHWHGYRPQLFDLQEDPNEYTDLGSSTMHQGVRQGLNEKILAWRDTQRVRKTLSDQLVESRTDRAKELGIYYGTW